MISKGRAYLQRRLDDPELAPETDTGIAAWLGHAWQLRELKDAGLVEENVELVQLAFHSYDDVARKEYVDAGIWMNLGSGRVYVTQTFRPYQAVKYIKSEDSFSRVAQINELCVYPGDINPRVRWDGIAARPIEPRDLAKIRAHGRGEFAAVVKEVKSTLKNSLADRHPIFALNYRRIGAVDKVFVVEDNDRRTPGNHGCGHARRAAQQSSAVACAEGNLARSNVNRALPARPRQPQIAGQAVEYRDREPT